MKTAMLVWLALLAVPGLLLAADLDIDGISGASYDLPPSLPRDTAGVKNEVAAWLASHWLMSLATVETDGSPHVSGVVYRSKEFDVYFMSVKNSNKILNILKDPRVSYTIWDPVQDIHQLKALQVRGRAEILEGEERAAAAPLFKLDTLPEHYAVVRIRPAIARWTDRNRPAEYSDVITFAPAE